MSVWEVGLLREDDKVLIKAARTGVYHRVWAANGHRVMLHCGRVRLREELARGSIALELCRGCWRER